MRAGMAGIGCVTPVGTSPEGVWTAIARGERATAVEMVNPETGRKYVGAPVPTEFTAAVARESRLRRSSAISLLAATAARGALASSGVALTPEVKSGLAVVFAVSSGGVQYTRRFYEQVVKQGANAASPLLFPETVYNAPASHLAAMLGIDGATYTVVGDGTVSLQALSFGTQLIQCGEARHVLVVAAEELDWILLEAHRDWRLTTDGSGRGALLAEGAAAVLLSRDDRKFGEVEVADGRTFFTRAEAAEAMESTIGQLSTDRVDLVVSGGNGTWVDEVIADAIASACGNGGFHLIEPKRYLGEALGTGALLQAVLAAVGLKELNVQRALVASLGWNQQAAAALVLA